jgi:alpha-glucosidase
VPAPVSGTPLLASGPCPDGVLPGATAAWWTGDHPVS